MWCSDPPPPPLLLLRVPAPAEAALGVRAAFWPLPPPFCCPLGPSGRPRLPFSDPMLADARGGACVLILDESTPQLLLPPLLVPSALLLRG